MKLNIAQTYSDGVGSIGVSSHEPNNNLYIYRLGNDDLINDKLNIPNKSTFYPFAAHEINTPPALTNIEVDSFGVENATGYGAGGFYHPIEDDYSYIVLPLHNNDGLQSPPTVEINQVNNVLNVSITISGTNYHYVRIYVNQNEWVYNKVIYVGKKSNGKVINLEIDLPVTATASGWIQAYANELEIVSQVVYF